MLIRRATRADASAAARVVADALAEHGLPFEPQGRDADMALFGGRTEVDDFVAEERGAVVGVVSVGAHGDAATAWVGKLFVVAACRGRGIGRALLYRAHDAAKARGNVAIGLRTRRVFREAIRLYESAGYVARAAESPGDVLFYRAL